MMRAASQELDSSRESLRKPLAAFMAEVDQLGLLDAPHGAPARSASEDGRTARRARRK